MKYIKFIFNFIKKRIYVNETVLMFGLKKLHTVDSKAIIKSANKDNIKDLLYFHDIQYIKKFEKFLELGDRGYLGYFNDKCVHRSWVKSNSQVVYPHWSFPYNLNENEIYIHHSETSEVGRGQNIYPHVLTIIVEENVDKNILISTNVNNISSIKGIEKVGFEVVYSIEIFIILGIKLIKVNDLW